MIDRRQYLAEASDRFLTAFVVSLMLFALKYATGATAHLASPEWGGWLHATGSAGGALGAVILLYVALSMFLRMTRDERRQYLSDEGYLMEMFRRAGVKALFLTFITLAVAKAFLRRFPNDLPGDFYVQSIMAIMLAIWGIAFAVLSRGKAEEEAP